MDSSMVDLCPLLPELSVPALLITGGRDLVCGPRQIEAFRERVTGGRVHAFPQAGHFVQVEDPGSYADLVISATDAGP
jgi:pimeloyl-ACP methyl ester carboxylesterase